MKFKAILTLLILFILSQLTSCNKRSHVPSVSFYYWKTSFSIDSSEKAYLDSLNVKKLYMRFFDVAWDESANQTMPLGVISGLKPQSNLQIIPTIFIVNNIFYHLNESQIEDLLFNIRNKIVSIYDSNQIKEIQFDCDWTEHTKSQYFYFLKRFIDEFPNIQISATIRLHQIKFKEKTGIPPIKSGMLMVYNIDKVGDEKTENSILNLASAKEYIEKLNDYPIHLNVALPIFSQGVLFRNTRALGLLNNLNENDLKDKNCFQVIENNQYKSLKNFYFCGRYIYVNDLIRLESVTQNDLENISRELSKRIKNKDIEITFFHLDTTTIKRFNSNEIKNIFDYFN